MVYITIVDAPAEPDRARELIGVSCSCGALSAGQILFVLGAVDSQTARQLLLSILDVSLPLL
jgi:hypothetical protein